MACYLVTGCAGFIGAKVTGRLLAEGHTVVGVDNLNDAYDVRLKKWRLEQLEDRAGLELHRLDITDRATLGGLFKTQRNRRDRHNGPFDAVINLAARAGVRQSVDRKSTRLNSIHQLISYAVF